MIIKVHDERGRCLAFNSDNILAFSFDGIAREFDKPMKKSGFRPIDIILPSGKSRRYYIERALALQLEWIRDNAVKAASGMMLALMDDNKKESK